MHRAIELYSFDSPLRSQDLWGGSVFLAAGGWVPCFLAGLRPSRAFPDRCIPLRENAPETVERTVFFGFVTHAYMYVKAEINKIKSS